MGYVSKIREQIGNDMLLIVGGGVFVYNNGKVLMQKRKDNGCWSLHGGCLEIGETVEETARRELKEETGLTAITLEFLGVFSGKDMLYTYPNNDKVCIVSVVYICKDFSGEIKRETNETSDLAWFDLDNLPDDISPSDKKPFQAFVEYIINSI